MSIESYYDAERLTLYLGDCIEVMRALPDASVDAIVTDPPYELGFMGKGWDSTGIANSVEMWSEALRVLKPGGHLAAFGGTRTYHRMACAIEDAGFEVRDCLAWMYGSGFPKSLDVSKAIDSTLLNGGSNSRRLRQTEQDGDGDAYTITGKNNGIMGETVTVERKAFTPVTDAARQWEGWGTALKPAYEPIVLARKPLIGTVAANVLQYGTGAINVDGCRIGTDDTRRIKAGGGNDFPHEDDSWTPQSVEVGSASGRWPVNVLMDEEAAAILDGQVGDVKAGGSLSGEEPSRPFDVAYGEMNGRHEWVSYGDRVGPSRFFYTSKASRSEREAGVEVEPQRRSDGRESDIENPRLRTNTRRNDHPTVKPVDLMRWLCRLVTPPGGVVLDCFNGSGTTGMAALDEGFTYIGIERDARYIEIAKHRITHRHVIEVVTLQNPDEESPQGRLL